MQCIRRWWANRASNRTCPITLVLVKDLAYPFRIVNQAQKVEVYDAWALIMSFPHSDNQPRSPLTRTPFTPVELLRLYHLAVRHGSDQLIGIMRHCIKVQKVWFAMINELNQHRQNTLRRSMWRLFYLGLSAEGRNMASFRDERIGAERLFRKLLFTHLTHGRKRTLLLLGNMDALFSEMSRRKRKRVLVHRQTIRYLQEWCMRKWKLESVFPLAAVSSASMAELVGAADVPEHIEQPIDEFYVPRLEAMYLRDQRLARGFSRFDH